MSKSKTYSLAELGKILQVAIKGDPNCNIQAVSSLQNAKVGAICFCDQAKHRQQLSNTQASAVVTTAALVEHCPVNALIVDDPKATFVKIIHLFHTPPKITAGIHPTAVIGGNCKIAPTATVGPYVVIEDNVAVGEDSIIGAGTFLGNGTVIGGGCYLFPNVTLYHGVVVKDRVTMHSGVVIGADGFGFVLDKQKQWHKIPQVGGVIIGNDVEIGANTTIDRAALDNTIIGDGVKIDNQVMIGHNVEIGDHTILPGCTGIAGSTKVGKHCMIGGGTCIKDNIEIGDHVAISGMGYVHHSLKKPGLYASGTGIQDVHEWHKNVARFKQLDKIIRRLSKQQETLNNE